MLPHLTTTETMEELKFLGGIRLRILLPTAATNGTVAVFEDIVEPGIGPGRHIHHGEDETFFVMEGQFAFEADGKIEFAFAFTALLCNKRLSRWFAGWNAGRAAFEEVWTEANQNNVSLRTAAFMIAIRRVQRATELAGT